MINIMYYVIYIKIKLYLTKINHINNNKHNSKTPFYYHKKHKTHQTPNKKRKNTIK